MNWQSQLEGVVRGAQEPPLLEHCIGKALDLAVHHWRHCEALVVCHQRVRWTFEELHAKVERLAANLLDLGLNPGDRLALLSQNNAEWVLTQFATAKAGIIQVNVNPAYRRDELAYALNDVGCRALILSPRFKSSDYVAMLRDLAPEIEHATPGKLRSANLPGLRWAICLAESPVPGMLRFEDLLTLPRPEAMARLRAVEARLSPTDPINIQFTSGTTGAPKGATLSHRNILNNGYMVGRALRLDASDRICIPVPLYHCFGMVMANLACLVHGACMVQPDDHFNAAIVLAAVERERCTVLYGVPTMFIAMLEDPLMASFELASLRTGIMAGAPCPMNVMRAVVDRMHLPEITIAYGMTETSPVSFQSAWHDPLEVRVATVGRIQPHLEAKVVDEYGHTLPRDVAGELLIRGYAVMNGYWGDSARTARAIDPDGWMHTGDVASINDEGLCRIVGRLKDMVIRGGENIYPTEVEGYLHGHPGIRDVQCVGVPDERLGEELCACIIAEAGVAIDHDTVRAFCAGKIAHYKIPRHVLLMDKFPMTVTGKVQKYRLREIVSDAFRQRTLEGKPAPGPGAI